MQNPPGVFIVIEGTDGSGKGTQFRLLKERLSAVGYDVEVFDFPRYEEGSSHFVRQYLNGAYGPAKNISPYTASLFYALDRFEASPDIRKALENGKIVLCNRFVGSNMAHQGGKFNDSVEQRSFFVWEDGLEYEMLGIPRPTVNIVLRVPAETAQKLVAKKNARSYTDKSHDEHEADIEHLKKSVATYDLLCQLFPNDFKAIDCTANGKLLGIPEINNKIWEILKPLLPAKPNRPGHSVVVKLNEEAKPKKSEKGVVKSDRVEISETLSLLAAYDFILAGHSLSAPGKGWDKSGYQYFVPEGLPKKTLNKYKEFMGQIVELNKQLKKKLSGQAESDKVLLASTPLAALAHLNASLRIDNVAPIIRRLALSDNPETINLANKLNESARAIDPEKFKGTIETAKAKGPEPVSKIIARLAAVLPQNLTAPVEPVELLEAWPRVEFKILADSIYPYSNLPRADIEDEIDRWSYQQKAEALEAAISAGGDTLDKFTYQFDITADRALLAQIAASGLARELKVQPATPRYGYDVPEVVDNVGATDEFLDCFDKSLELFSTLQAAGREDLAPYATLLGHKVRAQLTCSLGSINELLKSSGDSEITHLINQILEKVGERHPVAMAAVVKAQVPPAKEEKKADPKPEAKKANSKSRSRSRRRKSSKSSNNSNNPKKS